jgi:membrane protease YdiL (CAAX protease family)
MSLARRFFAKGSYHTHCPWPWWVALIDSVLLYFTAGFAAVVVSLALPQWSYYYLFPNLANHDYPIAFYVVGWCVWTFAAPWLLVAWLNRRGCLLDVLPLGPGSLGTGKTALLVIGAASLYVSLSALAATIYPDKTYKDAAYFIYYMHSPVAPLMLLMGVVGAPVMEEMMFRGFLQTALSSTRLGFWGASAILSAVWSLLHRYSWSGTAVVFSSGLVFSLLLWKTGSLRAGMVAHGLINLVGMMWIAFAYQ